jgi:plastocyanin
MGSARGKDLEEEDRRRLRGTGRPGVRRGNDAGGKCTARAQDREGTRNFFAPDALTVPKDTKIVWRWPSRPGDFHDVYLTRRPEGVKRFHSRLVASDFSFARKLRKPGRYRIVCTIHAAMTMSVKVRR